MPGKEWIKYLYQNKNETLEFRNLLEFLTDRNNFSSVHDVFLFFQEGTQIIQYIIMTPLNVLQIQGHYSWCILLKQGHSRNLEHRPCRWPQKLPINVWPEEIACLAKTLEKNELVIVGFVFIFIVLSRSNSKEHSFPCCFVTRICIPFASPM